MEKDEIIVDKMWRRGLKDINMEKKNIGGIKSNIENRMEKSGDMRRENSWNRNIVKKEESKIIGKGDKGIIGEMNKGGWNIVIGGEDGGRNVRERKKIEERKKEDWKNEKEMKIIIGIELDKRIKKREEIELKEKLGRKVCRIENKDGDI